MTTPVIGVKWVYQLNAAKVGDKMQAGQKPSLCIQTRAHTVCVAAGHPVRVVIRPAEEFALARDVAHPATGQTYPVPDAIRRLEESAQSSGITPDAARLLSIAKAWVVDPASLFKVDTQHFSNEEEMNEMNAETNNTAPKTFDPIPPPTLATKPPKGASKARKVVLKGKTKGSPVKASKAPKKPTKPKAPKTSPYRPGGTREKAYEAFLSEAKAVVAMDPPKRKEWAGRLARKLGLVPITAETYVQRFIRAYKA